jgi:hypothetical protein
MFESGSLLLNAVAGGLSGVAVDAVLFPLDTIKTRMQARRAGADAAARAATAAGRGSFIEVRVRPRRR